MRPATALNRELPKYNDAVAKSLARAVLATKEPNKEARVYCRDSDELVLALHAVRSTCEAMDTLDYEKSVAEVLRTGQIVLEMWNGSAIVFLLER